jgi:hypothetical protein
MKCLVIAYILSDELMKDIENVLNFYHFIVIENNRHYRVFTGYFKGGAGKFADQLNKELETVNFNIEDSLFIVYPVTSDKGQASISNLIIKRKGNKYLRRKFIN